MRRKVLQSFANTVCQQFLDLGSGHDVATYVRRGSGLYSMNVLTGECSHDGAPIPELKACREYRVWLAGQVAKHSIPPGLLHAALSVDVVVRTASMRGDGTGLGSADLEFRCRAELVTDEKVYAGEMAGSKLWGYMPDRDA